jgi:hypothetical protein
MNNNKAYRRITNDGASESPKQAVVRVVNQQIQVENQITNQRHERVEIGLFIYHIHTNILAFTPRDENIFQVILTLFKQSIFMFTFFSL